MMRLLFVLNVFCIGGRERRCLQLIQGLLKLENYQILVVVIDGDIEYQELLQCNVSILKLHRKEINKSPFRVFFDIWKVLRSFRPHVVHTWGTMSTFFLLPFSFFRKFGFMSAVADTMTPDHFFRKFVNWASHRCCDFIVGNSYASLQAYSVPSPKAICIYNGFNEDRFARTTNTLTLKNDLKIVTPFVVSMIARFSYEKDWLCFLNAAQLIADRRSDITFLCVGDGPDLDYVSSQLSGKQNHAIKFIGRRNDVDAILQITDISILCSNLKTKESLSNSIMESMAWGVPVIATAGGGTNEIIIDGVNGLLIHNQKSETVAEMIENLINDSDLRSALSNNARSSVRERFLLADKVAQYHDLYNSVCHLNID